MSFIAEATSASSCPVIPSLTALTTEFPWAEQGFLGIHLPKTGDA